MPELKGKLKLLTTKTSVFPKNVITNSNKNLNTKPKKTAVNTLAIKKLLRVNW